MTPRMIIYFCRQEISTADICIKSNLKEKLITRNKINTEKLHCEVRIQINIFFFFFKQKFYIVKIIAGARGKREDNYTKIVLYHEDH